MDDTEINWSSVARHAQEGLPRIIQSLSTHRELYDERRFALKHRAQRLRNALLGLLVQEILLQDAIDLAEHRLYTGYSSYVYRRLPDVLSKPTIEHQGCLYPNMPEVVSRLKSLLNQINGGCTLEDYCYYRDRAIDAVMDAAVFTEYYLRIKIGSEHWSNYSALMLFHRELKVAYDHR